jgi:hypothetical protein
MSLLVLVIIICFQQEILRAESKQPSEKLDMTRYIVTKPEGVLEKDIQAWRKAVSNAKVQYEHLTNQQMNMEVMEQHTASIWLHHNTALEGYFLLVATFILDYYLRYGNVTSTESS